MNWTKKSERQKNPQCLESIAEGKFRRFSIKVFGPILFEFSQLLKYFKFHVRVLAILPCSMFIDMGNMTT